MSELSKQALKVENNTSFPNNNSGLITPQILRDFNTDMIDSLVDEIGYTADSASWNQQINALEVFTASFTGSATNTGSLLLTASATNNVITFIKGDASTFNITVNTGSAADISALNQATASLQAFTASAQISITNLNASSASQQVSINNLNTATASLFSSASLGLTTASFSGNTLTFTKGNGTTFGVVIPDVSGSAGTTIFEVVYTGENITKGDPLYISGSQGANPVVYKADASNPLKMPVTFISNETIAVSNTTEAIVLGLIEGIDLTGYVAGQSIYVAEGGGWSLNLPSGSNSVTQLLGVVTKGGSGGKGLVLNPGPAQLPGLDTGYMWVGGTTNQPTEITTASFASSASFNTYTSSNDQKVNSLIAATGSYATTGSNSFIGNQIVNGVVSISGTATYDLDITGGFQATAASRISGSNGISSISQVSVQVTSGSGANLISSIMARGYVAATSASNQIALYGGISSIGGFGSGKVGGGIAVSSGSAGLYYFPIEFQTATSYTDGRVTFNNPISASAGFTASLQDGYAWVGNSLGQNTQVATSSFGTAINTGSFATTGSNSFIGNQLIEGNVTISGSATSDLTVVGQIFVSSSATALATAPKITVSGSAGQSIINRNSIRTSNTTDTAALFPSTVLLADLATLDEIGVTVDPAGFSVSGWTLGPAIYVNNTLDTYPAVFGFQNKANYTDGRVTVLTPLSAQQGLIITGSAPSILSSSFSGSLITNLTDIYTDVPSVQQIVTLSSASYAGLVSGSLIDPNTLYVVSGSTGVTIPAGTISSSAQITALGFVSSSITASSLITASVNLNTITFTKGDSSTFSLTVNTGSGGGGASFPYVGDAQISGSLGVTGSMSGFVNTLAIASNTASMNFNDGNFFTLQLVSGSITHLTATNIKPGQAINLLVKTDSGSASASGSLTFSPTFKFAGGFDYTPTAITASQDLVSFVTFDTTQIFAGQIKNLS
jgi:hypothetical protein